jgi:ADP-ribose pyrophosphatase YjhB (NUDIX family)
MKSIKIGVGLIIKNVNSNNFLIAKSPKVKNGWTMPGGLLELGEMIPNIGCCI